jgi:hypothetical protein
MEKVKPERVIGERFKKYTIKDNGVIDLSQLYDDYHITEALLIINPLKKSEMVYCEVEYLNPINRLEVIGRELHSFLSDSPAYIRIANPLSKVKVKGNVEVIVRWLSSR